MANILLTQRCVRSCPYCFAEKHMSESYPDDIMSWENLIYLSDFIQSSGEQRFSIMGGEPTLHPDFINMILYLLERNFSLNVFTSGIMSNSMLEEASQVFLDIPLDRLTFVCNLNDPEKTKTSLAELESVKRFLRSFGERVVPGFNIYRKDFKLDFLTQYINEYGLRKTIRLGLAHPIVGKKNIYMRINDIEMIINRLFSYAPFFERFRIKPGLDCGFPLCRFSDEQLAWLSRNTDNKNEFSCGPVIDIGPDMSVWSCFPLSSFQKKSIFEFNSIQEVINYYQDLHKTIRIEKSGIFDECDECLSREDGRCRGGCVAHSLSIFQGESPVRMKEVYL